MKFKYRFREIAQAGPQLPGLKTTRIVGKDQLVVHPNSSLVETINQRKFARRILIEGFNEEELRDICGDMGVNYDGLAGKGTHGKARELIEYLRRHDPNGIERLLVELKEQRPRWFEELEKKGITFTEPEAQQDRGIVARVCYFNSAVYSEGALLCTEGRLLKCIRGDSTYMIWEEVDDCESEPAG